MEREDPKWLLGLWVWQLTNGKSVEKEILAQASTNYGRGYMSQLNFEPLLFLTLTEGVLGTIADPGKECYTKSHQETVITFRMLQTPQ